MTMRAAIYVRISDDREGAGLGVARQEQDCRALAERLGAEVVEVYTDNDISAYDRRKRRPAYQRLLQDVQSGRVQVVLAWHTDRLHRSPRELEDWIEACEQGGVVVHTVKAGPLDLATGHGQLVARMLGSVATYESKHKSDRARGKALELARAGKVSGGGDRPFGYEPDRVTVRQSEAEIVVELVRRVLAGEGIRSVADDLNERGIPTSAGKQWKAYTTRRLLMSARISGRREHHGEPVATAVWPAIVSVEDSDRLRALLKDPARLKGERNRPRWLLTGLLRCARCGKGLVGRRLEPAPGGEPGTGKRRYVCNRTPGSGACGKTFTLAETVEAHLVELVLAALDTPGLARAREAEDQGAAEGSVYDQLRAVQGDLEALAEDAGAGRITRREWMVVREGLQRQAADLERRLGRERRTVLDAEDLQGGLRQAWPALSTERRRAILDVALERVVVHPGRRGYNRFDPDRFELVWRV